MFAAMLIPPRVIPPVRPLGRLAFLARFVRNPLAAIPQAVYEEDLVPVGRANPRAIWITSIASASIWALRRNESSPVTASGSSC